MSSSSESSSEYSPIPSKRRRLRHDTDSEDEDDIPNRLRDMRDDSYPLDGHRRGYALVFNNGSKTRKGSDEDCNALRLLFLDLGIIPNFFHDFDKEYILQKIEDFAKLEAQIMFIVFLSHGDENGIITYSGERINIDIDVIPKLRNDVAPKLANKPKIIWQQACRGPNLDSGVSINTSNSPTTATPAQLETDGIRQRQQRLLPTVGPTIPTISDIFIVYSSPMGFKSLRHPEEGSWLIQDLVNTIRRYSSHPIFGEWYQMCRIAANEMKYRAGKVLDQNGETLPAKSIPGFRSFLTKNLFLNLSGGPGMEQIIQTLRAHFDQFYLPIDKWIDLYSHDFLYISIIQSELSRKGRFDWHGFKQWLRDSDTYRYILEAFKNL